MTKKATPPKQQTKQPEITGAPGRDAGRRLRYRLLYPGTARYARGMDTHTRTNVVTYVVSCSGACSVTLTQNGKSITWQALGKEGGQHTFVVPAGAVASVSNPDAWLSVVPFKVALGAGNGSTGGSAPAGEPIRTEHGTAPRLDMQHATWCCLDAEATACTITPTAAENTALTMQLLLCPAQDMESGWLQAEGATLTWPYGEPALVRHFSYCVTLVQYSINGSYMLLANLTPLGVA